MGCSRNRSADKGRSIPKLRDSWVPDHGAGAHSSVKAILDVAEAEVLIHLWPSIYMCSKARLLNMFGSSPPGHVDLQQSVVIEVNLPAKQADHIQAKC